MIQQIEKLDVDIINLPNRSERLYIHIGSESNEIRAIGLSNPDGTGLSRMISFSDIDKLMKIAERMGSVL